jgi:hypothetical protein
MPSGVDLRVEDDLGDPLAVAQVDEDQPAMVAAAQGPAHQDDFASDVGGPQVAAVV